MENKTGRTKIINRDILKYIAVIPMAIGHFTGSFWSEATNPEDSVLLFLLAQAALTAPPVFFFFIAEGFRYTHSRKKYAQRLMLFSVITQIPFCLSEHGTLLTVDFFLNLNVFFTLFLGLVSLIICESSLERKKKIIFVILLDLLSLLSQWMLIGIPAILIFYYFKNHPKKRLLYFVLCMVLMLIISFMSYQPVLRLEYFVADFCFLMLGYLLVTVFYNGRKGKHPLFAKWFFYLFYPAHLLVIYLAKVWAGKF